MRQMEYTFTQRAVGGTLSPMPTEPYLGSLALLAQLTSWVMNSGYLLLLAPCGPWDQQPVFFCFLWLLFACMGRGTL